MQHTIPTPTTHTTDIIDAQQVTRTTWTVGDHLLIRIEREDAGDPHWITRNLTDYAPRLFESTTPDDEITYLIDWSSRSDCNEAEALDFAARLTTAVNTAQVFATIRKEAEHKEEEHKEEDRAIHLGTKPTAFGRTNHNYMVILDGKTYEVRITSYPDFDNSHVIKGRDNYGGTYSLHPGNETGQAILAQIKADHGALTKNN